MSRNIYVVGRWGEDYANWMEGKIVHEISVADLLLFTGGEDVDPSLYGKNKHPYTGSNIERDEFEQVIFNKAQELGKKNIGICRGSQFLCVMSGGELVQHQENKHYVHPMELWDGRQMEITSTHHQAAYPWRISQKDYEILGWTNGISAYHEDGNRNELPNCSAKECEIVYYRKTNSLGIQGHPEMMNLNHPTISHLREILNLFMDDKLDEFIKFSREISSIL